MNIPSGLVDLLPKPWGVMNKSEQRFTATLVAYAAGDAFGAFYEFSEIVSDIPNILRAKNDWPFGGTSDDTSLSIFTLISLKEKTPRDAAYQFLELMSQNQGSLRGLGPTTRAALGLPVKEKEKESIGFTNGAMMRTALLGLIYGEASLRTEWVRSLAGSTHRSYAVESAVLLSSAFAGETLHMASEWKPTISGVSNDAMESLHAVHFVVSRAKTPLEAMRLACSLGGDTDTVAALSAALVTAKLNDLAILFEIPWLGDVDWNGITQFTEALEITFTRLAPR